MQRRQRKFRLITTESPTTFSASERRKIWRLEREEQILYALENVIIRERLA